MAARLMERSVSEELTLGIREMRAGSVSIDVGHVWSGSGGFGLRRTGHGLELGKTTAVGWSGCYVTWAVSL